MSEFSVLNVSAGSSSALDERDLHKFGTPYRYKEAIYMGGALLKCDSLVLINAKHLGRR